MDPEQEQYLKAIYYDASHPASYSGLDKLYRAITREGRFSITKRKLKEWLKTQETYTLHHQVRRRFKRPRVVVSGIGKQADCDLMDMRQLSDFNKGINYVLVHIDDFSRYVRTVPLKSKHGKEVAKAFRKIFNEGGRTDKLRTDQGSEFTNKVVQKLFKDEKVHHFVTQNETKASLAERVIKTLKAKYFRHMTQNQTFRYIDIVEEVTDAYNHRYHRSIKMRPVDVTKENESQVWDTLYKSSKEAKRAQFTFNIGDWVRIYFLKRTFEREYDEKWSREIFKVIDRDYQQEKPVYTLADYDGERLEGRFYAEELQPVTVGEDDIYKIDKVIKSRKRRGHSKEFLVHWLGWPSKFDSWISEAELKNIRSEASTE